MVALRSRIRKGLDKPDKRRVESRSDVDGGQAPSHRSQPGGLAADFGRPIFFHPPQIAGFRTIEWPLCRSQAAAVSFGLS